MKKTKGILQLMRPANIITSVADVLAGIAISGFLWGADFQAAYTIPLTLLCISTIGLYGGGVVFNDVFDQELDKTERPERPIPKGVVTINEAAGLGILLLLTGIATAFLVNTLSGLIAVVIAIAALVYNKWSKHHTIAGPLNMGLCRGLNLLLGISIVSGAVDAWWLVAIIPIIYIAAITMISRGEVHGGQKRVLWLSAFLYLVVIGSILFFSFEKQKLLYCLPFIAAFAAMIFKPLIQAIKNPAPQNIGKSVKAGVIAIILLNASWAAAFGMLSLALLIILLLPLSLWLAKLFAVT